MCAVKKILFSVLLLAFPSAIYGQIDSLKLVIKNARHDSTIVNAWKEWDNLVYYSDPMQGIIINKKMDSLCDVNLKRKLNKTERYYFTRMKAYAINSHALYLIGFAEYDKAEKLLNECLIIYSNIKFDFGTSAALINLGRIYQEKNELNQALIHFTKALQLKTKLNDTNGIAICKLNIGNVHYNRGNYAMAIQYTIHSLKSFELIGNEEGIASALNNIGLIYHEQSDYNKAIHYYSKSLKNREKNGDYSGAASALNNLGLVYQEQKNYALAIEHYNRSFTLYQKNNDKQGMATTLNNKGFIIQEQQNYKEALPLFYQSLAIRKEIEDNLGISQSLLSIANNHFANKKYREAIKLAEEAYEIAEKYQLKIEIRDACGTLAELYKHSGNYKLSLHYFEKHITIRDSINSDDNQKEVIRHEFKYQYEKKATADSVANAKQQEIKNAEIARHKAELKAKRIQQLLLFGGLGLLLIFALFMFNRFKVTQRQKLEIEKQKLLVEEKQKEILDSIHYAKRIQQALLPSSRYLSQGLRKK